jgi:hypothetical protein
MAVAENLLHYWEPKIVKVPSLEISKTDTGGYFKIRWGDIAFSPDAFDGEPPDKHSVDLSFGQYSYVSTPVGEGTLLLREWTNDQIVYEMYDPEFDVNLLDESVDESGEECTIPLVVGTVTHMQPQRTGADNELRYFWPFESDVIGGINRAYVDGVEISNYWVFDGDTIYRTYGLGGSELTFSGTASMQNIDDVFSWGCTQLGLEYRNMHNAETRLDYVVDSQMLLIEFLDQVAYYCNCSFYIIDGVLTLMNNEGFNGIAEIIDFADLKYNKPERIKTYSATWDKRIPAVDVSQGHYLSSIPQEIILSGSHSIVGSDRSLDVVMNEESIYVEPRLQAILDTEEMWDISVSLPLTRFPQIYEMLTFQDVRKYGETINGWMKIEAIQLDYGAKAVNLNGHGVLTMG